MRFEELGIKWRFLRVCKFKRIEEIERRKKERKKKIEKELKIVWSIVEGIEKERSFEILKRFWVDIEKIRMILKKVRKEEKKVEIERNRMWILVIW